jgi:hypothetical protein
MSPGPLKNMSFTETHRTLSTRSVFVSQVLAVEGDPSWEIYRQQLVGEDNNDVLTQRRCTDKGSGRIIFLLREKDDLKIANPLLPRFYNIFPVPGDFVKIITYDIIDNDLSFDYIGPIIPSLINNNNSTGAIGMRNQDIFGNFSEFDPIIDFQSTNNDIKQIYPNPKDIAIIGRGSSQIFFKKIDENTADSKEYIVIRSGMYKEIKTDKVPTYNPTEAFIKVTIEPDAKIGDTEPENSKTKTTNFIKHIFKTKYDQTLDTTPPKTNDLKTRVDIVGQKINLFTYPSNRDEAYSIPYAELLFKYLSDLQTWLINHKHGIDGTPSQSPAQKLGNNLSIDDKGHISIPGKGTKIAITKDIKII